MPPSPQELYVKRRIDEVYTAHPFYGSRKITAVLRAERVINRKTVQRHMHEMGIAGICPGPHTSQRNAEHRVFPYLLRHVTASHPNHIWGIDITYIRLLAGWVYLVAVLDWYSRYVIAWELSDTLALPFVLECAQRALAQATPQIWNSDQGSHFTSPQYLDLLLSASVQISMDGRGRARATTSSPSACGARSSTRRSTSPNTLRPAKPDTTWGATSSSTTTSALTRRSITRRRPQCTSAEPTGRLFRTGPMV